MLTARPEETGATVASLIGEVLRLIRIQDSMQYCFMPSGNWETVATPAPYKPRDAIGFHILAGGTCWLDNGGQRTELREGDVAAFPFGTPHRIGAGSGGPVLDPGNALAPPPWNETPILRFGESNRVVRVLCGYVRCNAMHFAPFRAALPDFIHVSTFEEGDWLCGVVEQIVNEVDAPRGVGSAVLERLTELVLLEILRRQLLVEADRSAGWLAAIRDPLLGRCLKLFHDDPSKPWSLCGLAREAGASRSAITERFTDFLGRGPISYIREWRLFLAQERLTQSLAPISVIASEAGYSSEAAFTRAFVRETGVPPAAFRHASRTSMS